MPNMFVYDLYLPQIVVAVTKNTYNIQKKNISDIMEK